MAFTNSNDYLTGRKPAPFPSGSEVLHARFPLAVAAGDLALNTIGAIGILPAGCVPIDVRVAHTDLDTGAGAMVAQVGVWDGSGANISVAAADGGAHWGTFGAATAADAALTRNGNVMQAIAAAGADRTIGIKVTTAPVTAAAGTVWLDLFYRAA